MSVQAECPACKHTFIRPDGLAGKLEKCPQCRHVFRLPMVQMQNPPSTQLKPVSPTASTPNKPSQVDSKTSAKPPVPIGSGYVKARALVLILTPALDNAASVQSVAKQLAFSGGMVQVFNGPVEITRGRAAALLDRMDAEKGTNLLSCPFRYGTGVLSGQRYGYIIVGSTTPPSRKGNQEANQFSRQLKVGMTMKEVQEILGPPSFQLGGGEALGMYGKVSVIRSVGAPFVHEPEVLCHVAKVGRRLPTCLRRGSTRRNPLGAIRQRGPAGPGRLSPSRKSHTHEPRPEYWSIFIQAEKTEPAPNGTVVGGGGHNLLWCKHCFFHKMW